jgi:SAM-dependent methyltransferase
MGSVVWAQPRNITSLSDCFFYHTMDIPGYGTVHGESDLRGTEASYLGNVSLQGKRVLEVGTASGHLCFFMERMGAEVVAYDASDEQEWDTVPYAGYDCGKRISQCKEQIRRMNNGFWLAHRAYKARAKVTYGTAYEIPDDIGQFDICVFNSILLHLRDPFLALQRASAHVSETTVVTDVASPLTASGPAASRRLVEFLPNADECSPTETWWRLSPELVSEFMRILGFVHTKISFHVQLFCGNERVPGKQEVQFYTVVGHRKGVAAAQLGGRGAESGPVLSGESDMSVDEATLQSMRFSTIAKHLLKRGIRAIPKRLLARN